MLIDILKSKKMSQNDIVLQIAKVYNLPIEQNYGGNYPWQSKLMTNS